MEGDEPSPGAPAAGTALAPEPPRFDAAAAAAVAGLIAWAVVELLGGAAGVVAGSLAFSLAFAWRAVGLHIVSAHDAAWLDDQLGHRLGGRLGRGLRLVARPAPLG